MTFEALLRAAPPPLAARWLGSQRIDLAECGSTNDEAGRLARAGARHGTVVIAESQRSGRGRDGRVWQSPKGGLYLSAVLRPTIPLVSVPPMTLAIGIGLCDAARTFGAPAVLKWPNDLLVEDRKLAGVLVEAQSQGQRLDAVVVGIGVNLDTLPEQVSETAISLTEAAGTLIDRELFIAQLLARVERWIERYVGVGLEAIIPAWQERMATGLAARATVDGAPLTGEVTGLDLDGALLLRDEAGQIHRVRSGDVEVIRPSVSPSL
ncbi:MAG: BirA bifunctional protein [Myxococcales bacterium]|nr:BirA bifunctional protein [Myxococcales bacterium]